MKKQTRWFSAALRFGLLCLASHSLHAADGPYRLLKEIPIGGEGGWDYLSVDAAAHRLYVTHGNKVVAIDVTKDTVVGEVTNTPGVHGFAFAPKLNRGFASNGRENKVSIVDLKTLETLSKVDTGSNPDAILYEPSQNEVYAFNGRGASATVFDAGTGKLIATVPLGGKPESGASDAEAGRVYNNIEDKNEVVAIDLKTHQVVNRWPIAPGEGATGMAYDQAHHRLFLGCGNNKLVMMDSVSGKVVASISTGPGVDAAAFDPGTQYAFASAGGNGTVTIAHEDSPEKLTEVQTLTTKRGSRTMTLDPSTHRIYLAAVEYAAGGGRGQAVAGSFKVLVYGMEPAAAR